VRLTVRVEVGRNRGGRLTEARIKAWIRRRIDGINKVIPSQDDLEENTTPKFFKCIDLPELPNDII